MDVLSCEEPSRSSRRDRKKYAKKQNQKQSNDVADSGNISGRKSRRLNQIVNVENAPDIVEQSSDVTDGENNSRRRSRRLTQVANNVENTPVVMEENKSWSEDSEIELKTPMPFFRRAGTFSVETPVTPMEKQPKLVDAKVSVTKSPPQKCRRISTKKVSAPVKDPVVSYINVKVAICEDKTYVVSGHKSTVSPAKTPGKSILRQSKNVYSAKKSSLSRESKSKVNFVTPDRRLLRRSSSASETPLRSVKDRPKTPIANSGKRKRAISPLAENNPKMLKTLHGQATPKLANGTFQDTKASVAAATKLDKGLQTDTPRVMCVERKMPVAAANRIHSARKQVKTPSKSVKKKSVPEIAKGQTPNFKEIHAKAFEKMESLEQYHERKENRIRTLTKSQKKSRAGISSTQLQQTSTKKTVQRKPVASSSTKPSRIPQPFIPSVKSIRKINTNFAAQAKPQSLLHSTSKMADMKENAKPSKKCQRSLFTSGPVDVFKFAKVTENSELATDEKNGRPRRKFDLKASLAKKLPYKPYRGALKPLADSNANQTQVNSSYADAIKRKREECRGVLKGIRKNRRFELQMSRRGIA